MRIIQSLIFSIIRSSRVSAGGSIIYYKSPLRAAPPLITALRHSLHAAKRTSPPGNMTALKIGTHNGSFHCDEVLACYLLQQIPRYQDAEIVRTRDPAVLDQCDVVVDVGGVYDPKKHRYDHHQRSFVGTFNSVCPEKPWVTKLSSAGLIYVHFGRQVLCHITHLAEDSRELGILYDKMYENFIEEVDAVDNGISQCDGDARYTITTSLSARVGYLNPRWNSETQDTEVTEKKPTTLTNN